MKPLKEALFSRRNLNKELILSHKEKWYAEYLSLVCTLSKGKQIFNIHYKLDTKYPPEIQSFETTISIGEAGAKILQDFIENYDDYDSHIFIDGVKKHTGIDIDLGFRMQIIDNDYSKEMDIDYYLIPTEIDELKNYLKANL